MTLVHAIARCYNHGESEREKDSGHPFQELLALHEEIDRQAAQTAELFGLPLRCRLGCAGCCVDGLAVLEIEADRIRRNHPDLLSAGDPHPKGSSAFLDGEGARRIYDDRPYVCRAKGLTLRWFDETPSGETVEMRDICPLNDPGEELGTIDEGGYWSIGPLEGRLAELQYRIGGDRMRRIVLRTLFLGA